MLTLRELSNLSDKELKEELIRAKKELFILKINVKTTKEKATHKVKAARRYAARILTIIRELELSKKK